MYGAVCLLCLRGKCDNAVTGGDEIPISQEKFKKVGIPLANSENTAKFHVKHIVYIEFMKTKKKTAKKAIRRNLNENVLRELRGGQQAQQPPVPTSTMAVIAIKC